MNIHKEIHTYKGFKLISLDLRDTSLLGTIFYDFINPEDKQSVIYSTVIIGPNGTGKSNLFKTIIWLFKELYDLSKTKSRSYNVDGRFNLKYSLDGNIYEYTNIINSEILGDIRHLTGKNSASLYKNGDRIEFNEAEFPVSIVANSIMLTDKYPIYNDEDAFPNYKYLGVRNRPQMASTRSYVRKTVEFIVEQINSDTFKNGIEKTAKFLGISKSIDILFYTQNTTSFFKGELSKEKLVNYFEEIDEKYKNSGKTPPFKLNHYQSISKDEKRLGEVFNFCNQLFKENRLLDNYRSSTKTISYNIVENNSHRLLKKDYLMLEHLRKLGMISAPEIYLNRGHNYNLQESSSGEYHFFSSIVGLMATMKPHSLIFIDEPEISLHPNWQMQYLSFIRELFSNSEYATCHLFVATHSHFLISDLKGESSKIIGLRREIVENDNDIQNPVRIVDLPYNVDTYGWSAEDVLYNVFNVASTRNKFVAEDIANILNELSAGDKNQKNKLSTAKYAELVDLENSLKEGDPLKMVVTSILKKINE